MWRLWLLVHMCKMVISPAFAFCFFHFFKILIFQVFQSSSMPKEILRCAAPSSHVCDFILYDWIEWCWVFIHDKIEWCRVFILGSIHIMSNVFAWIQRTIDFLKEGFFFWFLCLVIRKRRRFFTPQLPGHFNLLVQLSLVPLSNINCVLVQSSKVQ